MKGIVFTEFLDFVGAQLGPDMVDDIIDDAALPHGGAYTSVGTYPYAEMGALVGALAQRTGAPAPDLIRAFGAHLCRRFTVKFAHFFEEAPNLFDFLESVDTHIHVEVHKLYPDAELPKFRLSARGADSIDLDYASCRPLESLAEGMILSAAEHYGERVDIAKAKHEGPDGAFVRFSISRVANVLAA